MRQVKFSGVRYYGNVSVFLFTCLDTLCDVKIPAQLARIERVLDQAAHWLDQTKKDPLSKISSSIPERLSA